MRHSPSILLSLCCGLFLSACRDDPNERHLDRRVVLADIIGTWEMTQASRDLLRRDGQLVPDAQKCTITFQNDGWLKFKSVLDDVKGGTYGDCLGTWRLDYDKPIDGVPRPNLVEMQLRRKEDRYFKKLAITEEAGNLRLWSFYGDPKLREFIEYERPGAKPKEVGW